MHENETQLLLGDKYSADKDLTPEGSDPVAVNTKLVPSVPAVGLMLADVISGPYVSVVNVGTAVGVGVNVGAGVDVGTGVGGGTAVAVGTGVGVTIRVGVGVGTAVAVGTGVGIIAAPVRSNTI